MNRKSLCNKLLKPVFSPDTHTVLCQSYLLSVLREHVVLSMNPSASFSQIPSD